jgi:hypothetical protein
MIQREPVITAGVLTALAAALLTLLESFGVPLTPAQQDAINSVVVLLAPLVMALIVRRYVTPVADPRDNAGRRLTAVEDVE